MRFLPKQDRNLQLPSFESLGIAVPSPPNNTLLRKPRWEGAAQEPFPLITDVSSLPSSASLPDPPPNVAFSKSYPSPLPITPPEYDDHGVQWTSNSSTPSFPVKPPADQPRMRTPVNEPSDSNGDTRSPQQSTPEASRLNGDSVQAMSTPVSQLWPEEDGESWLKNGYAAAVSSLAISKRPGEAVQLISQSLPCPPADSSASAAPLSAFVPIVQAIQGRLQPGQSPYVNIIHAVPPKFSLSSLPTSPPSTPNLLFPGDDYFNLTVFSSATPVPSYPHSDFVASPFTAAAPYVPAPIVPPYSVHVSVIERYLPPPTAQEYKDMFSFKGPSALVDRLLELSPNDGSLVFIYPTKQGARTFEQHYLSPILDPLLRHLVVVNRLSADIGMTLGHMGAISSMDDFETMKSRIVQLCHDLNARGKSSCSQALRTDSRFNMVYAEKGGAHVDRRLWTEWHIQQDTPRARTVLSNFWRNHYSHLTKDDNTTGTRTSVESESAVLRELLDGIRRRSYSEPEEPQEKLELGMFVIKRSQEQDVYE